MTNLNINTDNENLYLNYYKDISNITNKITLEINAEKEQMINIKDKLEDF